MDCTCQRVRSPDVAATASGVSIQNVPAHPLAGLLVVAATAARAALVPEEGAPTT
jgi:hypothetical protein